MSVSDHQFRNLEDRVVILERDFAVDAERHKTLVSRLDKIDDHINKLVWVIMTGILGAIMTFLVKGGFSL